MVVNLRGITSEVCKNIVLAGVGSITILDDQVVSPEDLGAGIFFREEDIGEKRVEVAKGRIKSLNPRVDVIGLTETVDLKICEDGFLASFDIVCLTDSSSPVIERVNTICRLAQKPFFAAASFGINGYIFADLLDHTYLHERETTLDNGEIKKTSEKRMQSFLPFAAALKSPLNHVSARRLQKVAPMLWACLALFEYQAKHGKDYPTPEHASVLIEASHKCLEARSIDKSTAPENLLMMLARTSAAEFIASCAIIGSVLSQEILNTLGGKQAPLANFFVFDGEKCSGDIYAFGIERT